MGWLQNIGRTLLGYETEVKSDPNLLGPSYQFVTPGQPIGMARNYAGYTREGYRRNPTVYACINKIAGTAATIRPRLYADRTMKREIESHPVLDLLQKPNTRQGYGEFVQQAWGYWHLAGNEYLWANRPNPNAPPLELWNIRPDQMKISLNAQKTDIGGYVYGYGSQNPRVYDPSEIMHIKFEAFDDDLYGLSQIEVAAMLIDQETEGNQWNTAIMANAGKPSGLLSTKTYLTDEQRSQVKKELLLKFSGKRNAGMPMVMEADMSWQSMSMTPYELDWLKSREMNKRDIASIFDVAPELVGDAAGKTFANQKEARVALILFNVLPKMENFFGHMNLWLLPMYPDLKQGAFLTYDKEGIDALQEIYQETLASQSQRAQQVWMNTGCSLDEYRKLVGLPAMKNKALGKLWYVNKGVLVLEDDLEAYAKQSMSTPAAPPMPVPEPIPALPAPGTQPSALPDANVPQDENNAQSSDKKPVPTSKKPSPKQPPTTKPNPKKSYSIEEIEMKSDETQHLDIWQDPDTDATLAAYRKQGVVSLTWVCDKYACDVCQQNNGVTVAIGEAFPSSHLCTPAHPHCGCSVLLHYAPNAPETVITSPKMYVAYIEQHRIPRATSARSPLVLDALPVAPNEQVDRDGDEPSRKRTREQYRAFMAQFS